MSPKIGFILIKNMNPFHKWDQTDMNPITLRIIHFLVNKI
jgi:hypothetical protein